MRENILAHRGYWLDVDEQNTEVSFSRALKAGFGIETDLRDQTGNIVISHNVVDCDTTLSGSDFFQFLSKHKSQSRIALNIKSDGLQNLLEREFSGNKSLIERCYVFDMSVPDALIYGKMKLPMYTRVSDYEPTMTLKMFSQGVWVDNFEGSFQQVEIALSLVLDSWRVAFVSPELHGRKYETCWEEIRKSGLHKFKTFELCTDHPDQAYEFFNRDNL